MLAWLAERMHKLGIVQAGAEQAFHDVATLAQGLLQVKFQAVSFTNLSVVVDFFFQDAASGL